MNAINTKILDKLKNEKDLEYEAFLYFLKMNSNRNLVSISRLDPRFELTSVVKWAKKFKWFERAGVYDQLQHENLEFQIDPANVNRKHSIVLRKAGALIQNEIEKWLTKSIINETPAVGVRDLSALAKIYFDYERLISNQATSNIKINDADYSKLSDSELELIYEIEKKIRE